MNFRPDFQDNLNKVNTVGKSFGDKLKKVNQDVVDIYNSRQDLSNVWYLLDSQDD